VEAQRLELGLVTARNAFDRTWRQLAAVTGNSTLEQGRLEGNLEQLPEIDFNNALSGILAGSPELKSAELGAVRSDLLVRRNRVEVIPDIFVRAGAHYNYERLELSGRPVGLQGSVEVGVALPVFNRNQGAVAAARADAERARYEVESRKVELRLRLAEAYREYRDAAAAVERYRKVMIPRAREAYELYMSNFRSMAAAYPQVIIAQRNLFQLQEDYISSLILAWQRSVDLRGMLIGADRVVR
jgi:cobalt-zinc-cadmium efflux system outer membrane protein